MFIEYKLWYQTMSDDTTQSGNPNWACANNGDIGDPPTSQHKHNGATSFFKTKISLKDHHNLNSKQNVKLGQIQ